MLTGRERFTQMCGIFRSHKSKVSRANFSVSLHATKLTFILVFSPWFHKCANG